jgi:hypothetical protein
MGVLERAEATSGMPIASPPSDTLLMSYPVVGSQTRWMLHHAAPFAAARWTNVFDPARFVVFGDVIAGPLAHLFGDAITDVDLRAQRGGRQSWRFTHTKYWSLDEPTRLAACREAVDLLDRGRPLSGAN